MNFSIAIRESGGITVLDVVGQSTLASHGTDEFSRYVKKLIAEGKHKILLNLSELTQIDSTGVSVIVGACASLRNRQGELKLLRPHGRVLEVLNVLRLLKVIPSFDDEAEALASFETKGLAVQT